MKLATTIIRVLLGALLLFASLMFFLKLAPEPEVTGDFKAFNVGLVASKYIIPLAKGVELLCGISFITNKYVALANLVILPVSLNIFLINFFMTPENLPIAIFICFANLFLIYRYWDHYKGLVTPN
jgi:putative oxidoreductase